MKWAVYLIILTAGGSVVSTLVYIVIMHVIGYKQPFEDNIIAVFLFSCVVNLVLFTLHLANRLGSSKDKSS